MRIINFSLGLALIILCIIFILCLLYILEIGAIRYVLPYEAIGVFYSTFLPLCMRIGKVYFYAHLLRNVLMTKEFRPVVCCDGLYPFPVWFQQVYYRLCRLICIFAMGQFSHD